MEGNPVDLGEVMCMVWPLMYFMTICVQNSGVTMAGMEQIYGFMSFLIA
jgi:hypothetical protein